MGFLIAAFCSRTQAMLFRDALLRSGVHCSIVNTPREARVGCGLSVRLDSRNITRAKMILGSGRFSNFSGFFSVSKAGNKTVVRTYI